MSYFFYEFRRAITSKNFLIVYVIGFISLFIGGFEFLSTDIVGSTYIFSYAYDSGTMCTFIFLAPIIASVPFSMSYIFENEEYFSNYIYIRMSKLKYFTIKFVINSLIGGLTIFLSTFSYYILVLAIRGVNSKDLFSMNIGGDYLALYNKNQILCMLVVVSLTSIFGYVFASFSLAISTFIKNKYLTIIIPFAIYLFSGMFLYNYEKLNLQVLYSLRLFPNVSIFYRIIYSLILVLISYVLFIIGAYLKEDISG
jgi:hypothetical protein